MRRHPPMRPFAPATAAVTNPRVGPTKPPARPPSTAPVAPVATLSATRAAGDDAPWSVTSATVYRSASTSLVIGRLVTFAALLADRGLFAEARPGALSPERTLPSAPSAAAHQRDSRCAAAIPAPRGRA